MWASRYWRGFGSYGKKCYFCDGFGAHTIIVMLVLLAQGMTKSTENDVKWIFVHPWGVEPQSLEPESNILSIELWVRLRNSFRSTKVVIYLLLRKFLKHYECEN